MKHYRILMLLALALPLTTFAKEAEEGDDDDLSLDQVPAKVAEAIRAAAGNAELSIEEEDEDGAKSFEAKWSAGDHEHELTIAADGTVVSEEEEIALESAPAAVQATVKELSKASPLAELVKVTEDKLVSYEASFKTGEGELEVKIDTAGKETARNTEKKEGKDHEEEDDDDDDNEHEDDDVD